jgi:hypothetical protein
VWNGAGFGQPRTGAQENAAHIRFSTGALKGKALIVNAPTDHVHWLLSMPAAIAVADLLRVSKTSSCRWVHEQFPVGGREELRLSARICENIQISRIQ